MLDNNVQNFVAQYLCTPGLHDTVNAS